MGKKIKVEVYAADGTRTEEVRPAHDTEFYNNWPFESENVHVTRVTDIDD